MRIDLINFFSPGRLFNLKPAPLSSSFLIALSVIFGLLVLAAIVIKVLQNKNKFDQLVTGLLNRYFRSFLTMGLLGVVYIWFRIERVMVLSGRFWLVIWLVGLIIWLIPIIKHQKDSIPQIRSDRTDRKNFEKYLPKKK
jgi:hypothetical protein